MCAALIEDRDEVIEDRGMLIEDHSAVMEDRGMSIRESKCCVVIKIC